MISEKLQKGQLLIAEPTNISNLSFNRSVILLTDYSKEGSVGFIINKPSNHTINDLIPDVMANFKIYFGGPVEQDNLYFIHNVPDLIDDSVEISNGIYWGGDFALTKNLINTGEITKDNIRFFLGYTCWIPNQLEKEMELNLWIISDNLYENKIIGKSCLDFWKEKILELGDDYIIWSNTPENPLLN